MTNTGLRYRCNQTSIQSLIEACPLLGVRPGCISWEHPAGAVGVGNISWKGRGRPDQGKGDDQSDRHEESSL